MTDRRRPLHLGIFLGLSAGAYGLSLAGVTAFQAQSEAAIAADQGPTQDAIASLGDTNDSLAANADQAGQAYDRATGEYDRVGKTLADVEAQLARLAKAVGGVDGAAKSLPSHASLPKVSHSVGTVAAPAVHATTKASGG